MRIKSLMLFFLLISVSAFVNAQGGNSRQRTVEERVKMIHEKMDSVYKFDVAKQTKIDTVFAGYFRQQDKIREEFRNAGERPDFETVRNKMQPAIEARDKELKTILTEEEYKKWKEELEPALMQRRGGGGGANRQ